MTEEVQDVVHEEEVLDADDLLEPPEGYTPVTRAAKREVEKAVQPPPKTTPKPKQATQINHSKNTSPTKVAKKSHAGAAFLLFLFITATIAGYLLYMDVGGIRSKYLPSTIPKDTVSATDERDTQRAEDMLRAVEAQRSELEKFERNLNAREAELNEREFGSTNGDNSTGGQSSTSSATGMTPELAQVVSLYSEMDAFSAADILSAMNDTDLVVSILKNLPSDQTAQILASMPPKTASTLTLLIYRD